MRHRASVCGGSFEGSDSRACNAESFADRNAWRDVGALIGCRDGDGDGSSDCV